MTSLVAILPAANLLATNAALETAGFGPSNFSVASFTGGAATHAALHAWHDAAFVAAVKAIAGVVTDESTGDPVARTKALIEAQGAQWGAQAPELPATGNVTAGSLYRFEDELWSVIQTFSRTTYPAHPSTYPALIRRAIVPGVRAPWVQPTDQFNAYKLVNPFTGLPDEVTHAGETWRVVLADGAGNNVWMPGQYGWEAIGDPE